MSLAFYSFGAVEANGTVLGVVHIFDIEFFKLEVLMMLLWDTQINGSLLNDIIDVINCSIPVIIEVSYIPNKLGDFIVLLEHFLFNWFKIFHPLVIFFKDLFHVVFLVDCVQVFDLLIGKFVSLSYIFLEILAGLFLGHDDQLSTDLF